MFGTSHCCDSSSCYSDTCELAPTLASAERQTCLFERAVCALRSALNVLRTGARVEAYSQRMQARSCKYEELRQDVWCGGSGVAINQESSNAGRSRRKQETGAIVLWTLYSVGKVQGCLQIKLPPHMKIHPIFHVSQLKLYKKPTNEDRTYQKPDPILIAAGEEEYEVEEIINHRTRRCGRHVVREYLILWKGYPAHEMTWEPET